MARSNLWTPLELLDKSIGSTIQLIMKSNREITGILEGFDDYMNMVLRDAVEFEMTPEGKTITKLDEILLSGNNVVMMVPAGCAPSTSGTQSSK